MVSELEYREMPESELLDYYSQVVKILTELKLMGIVFTEKQKAQLKLLNNLNYRYILSYGGVKAGKTFSSIAWLVFQAGMWTTKKGTGISIAIIRDTLQSVKKSIQHGTLLDILRLLEFRQVHNIEKYKDFHQKVYSSDDTKVTFPNGATINFYGLEDNELDRLLDTEHSILYFNEISTIKYNAYSLVQSRAAQYAEHVKLTYLNSNRKLIFRPKILLDLNPTSIDHYSYKIFFEQKNPVTDAPIENFEKEYASIAMNPVDNYINLSPDFKAILEALPPREKERFLYGRYQSEQEYALWQQDEIGTPCCFDLCT